MSHCLVSFLGRVLPKDGGEYRKVDYYLDNECMAQQSAYLGFPLRRRLNADRLVIFGTTGSMWDHLFEGDLPIEGAEDIRMELMSEAENGHVQQTRLDQLAPCLAKHLGCDVQLQIIPTALQEIEQTQLISMLAQAAKDATKLSIDVTHGFRHLPMLAFTAALYLRAVRSDLTLYGLWYGALSRDVGTVHNLKGLLETADWLSALQRQEWLGDYGAVANLVDSEHPKLAEELKNTSFLESIHQGQSAKEHAERALACLHRKPLQGPARLFEQKLRDDLRWVKRETLDLRQRQQALNALAREDFLRASLFGFEAVVTRLAQRDLPEDSHKLNDFHVRKNAQENFEEKAKRKEYDRDLWRSYTL
ncbi:MAG TPA: TIGR02221 family CRISPR-associated protein, partial [Salinisphaeraceae bacterium]|nr:TIGR02221 family CRISPR-associated protein [Salinisphaeraceae bacterium]